jgi:hypothetical protein
MNERAIIAFIFILGLVILTNLLMFGIVQSFLQGGKGRNDLLQRILSLPLNRTKPSIDELRERVKGLQTGNQSPDAKQTNTDPEPSQPNPGFDP